MPSSIYAILADEASDVACNEQLTITICWVSDEYEVFEDLIGLLHLSKTNADALVFDRCTRPIGSFGEIEGCSFE